MDDIALVTPTSDRPFAFELCERWMSRAISFCGPRVKWYVADDGINPVRCTMGQTYIHRPPCESKKESFLGNLLAALDQTREQKILFIEDDDWYSEDYIATASSWLDEAAITGESRAKYYNVASRKYKLFTNTTHASLSQTGIRRTLLEWFANLVTTSESVFVDMDLWKFAAEHHSLRLESESRRCIGIKGLPGKMGLNEGHSVVGWGLEDPDGTLLRSWIGQNDAEAYLKLSECGETVNRSSEFHS